MAIKKKINIFNRLAVVTLFLFATAMPLFDFNNADAYALLPSRSITMDSSAEGDTTIDANNDGDTDGVNVTYHVRFDIATAANFGGIVVEFCDNSPIISDTDTACNDIDTTYAFDIGTPTVSGQSNGAGVDFDSVTDDCDISTFTSATALTTHTLALTASTPVALAAGATCFFDLTTVTNPNVPNHTFFARIYAYSEAAEATGYTLADPNAGVGTVNDEDGDADNDDDFIDAGGIALSTAEQITITSRVPEKLTFCVFTVDGSSPNTCGTTGTAPSGNAITLGDDNGVLSELEEFVNKDAKFTISTNALYDVAVRIKGGTLKTTPGCSEAATQTCSIDSIDNALANGDFGSSEGTEQFGLCTYQSSGSGLTVSAPYNSASAPGPTLCSAATDNSGDTPNATAGDADNGAYFGFFNDSTSGSTSTYGDVLATKSAGTFSTGVLTFLGNIAITTEPGIYTTTMTFIATGTY